MWVGKRVRSALAICGVNGARVPFFLRCCWRLKILPAALVAFAMCLTMLCFLHGRIGLPGPGRGLSFSRLQGWRQCAVELPVPFRAQLPLRFPAGRRGEAAAEGTRGASRIPHLVHFIFGYKWDDAPFTFMNYMAVVSALVVLRPDVVMMHCAQEPTGFFWELVKPHVQLVQGREVTSVFGNPVEHYSHKSDVVRLEVLLEHGGIYLDIDVLTLRPFEAIMDVEAAMGEEGEKGWVGLCNAVILAAPNAAFLRLWYDEYQTFNKSQWNYHSVQLPKTLAKAHPELISRLPYDTFHWPLWDEKGMKLMFDSFSYDYASNKAVHVWNHGVLRSEFQNFSMPWCFECRSTLLSMMRSYVPDPLFSVITPCYNQSAYIADALRSVARQTFPYWEVIVIDDRSPDRCGAVAQAFAAEGGLGPSSEDRARLKVILSKDNLGLAQSRNAGIAAARGVWICALDADDRLGPGYFSEAARAMSLRPDLQLIYSNQEFFGDSDWVWPVLAFETATVTAAGPLPVMSLYLRSLWENVAGYSSSLPWGNEDYDFWLKVLELGVRYEKLPGNHVFYRFKQQSMMRKGAAYAQEELAMMRTRHLAVFHPAKVLRDHRLVMKMANATRERLLRLQASKAVGSEDKAYGTFWLALSDMWRGDHGEAASRLRSVVEVGALQWQPALYHALCVCRLSGRAAAAPLLESLLGRYPHLNRTHQFQRHDANCRGSLSWPGPAPRRDADADAATAAAA